MTSLDQKLESLSPDQRRLVERWLREQPEPESPAGILRRHATDVCPLSFAQQRMWLLDQLEPGNPLYTMTPTMRLTGPLDIAALARGLNAIIARHEVLRATFPAVDGRPV